MKEVTYTSIYNPGFSVSYLISLMPHILREVLTFYEILRERGYSGVVLALEEATLQ